MDAQAKNTCMKEEMMSNKRILWTVGILFTLGAIATVLLAASFAAPTTEHLIIQAVGHEGLADEGNKKEAMLVVSIYNAAGPITRMAGGSFSIKTAAFPEGGYAVKKSSVTEVGSGIYQIALVPDTEDRNAVWKKGAYAVGVVLTSPNGSGIAVATLRIDP